MKNHKKSSFLALFFCFTLLCCSQNIQIDDGGLVSVDGKSSFYMISKKHDLLRKDYSLQDLQHNELAFFTFTIYKPLYENEKHAYHTVFSKSGSFCDIYLSSDLGTLKQLVNKVVSASLVENNAVSAEAERKFVTMYSGVFAGKVEEKQVAAKIKVDGSQIFNDSKLIGSFKKAKNSDQTEIVVYNPDGLMVCKAARSEQINGGDWVIKTDAAGEQSLLYNESAPLEKLFAYLADKKIL